MSRTGQANPITPALARYRRLRWALWAGLALLAGLAAFDRGRVIWRGGDDWRRFDGRPATVLSVEADLTLSIKPQRGDPMAVRLLGVGPPIHATAQAELAQRCAGQIVTLTLEPTQTRDAAGRLLAYVYDADHALVNHVLVREGLAGADPAWEHRLRGSFQQAQAEARQKQRGVWGDANMQD